MEWPPICRVIRSSDGVGWTRFGGAAGQPPGPAQVTALARLSTRMLLRATRIFSSWVAYGHTRIRDFILSGATESGLARPLLQFSSSSDWGRTKSRDGLPTPNKPILGSDKIAPARAIQNNTLVTEYSVSCLLKVYIATMAIIPRSDIGCRRRPRRT